VLDVTQVTGFPEMLDGRVKTLHPKLHGGILARRDVPEDLSALSAHGIEPIDVVVVNLYPFRETVARPGVRRDEAVEQIDIGGPSLLRAAAKNHAFVTVLVDPADYDPVLAELRAGEVSVPTRRRLMQKVFAHTGAYDLAIARHFAPEGDGGDFPRSLVVTAELRQPLRYGENPHQRAAWYGWGDSGAGAGLAAATILQGKELSYNNLLDLHSAVGCVREFPETAAVVVKHNTPCGVAVGEGLAAAYRLAREADPVSAFGGIVAFNETVDGETARLLAETFLEAIVAPAFAPEAREALGAKKNLRLLELPSLRPGGQRPARRALELRSVGDGLLLQEADGLPADPAAFRVVSKRHPTPDEERALLFAWRVVRHVRSNAIVFAAAERTLAIGGGQTSRVEAVELAARKGGERLRGSAVASDAFFPFRDGLDAAARAGAGCVVQPGGSVRDAEVVAAADEHGLAMVFTDRRHFRH
ncbi:MAG: bifunctional phosphoribosylaminoimidazolecarboxamide formyltransferase/IMP cyclohydrolase, partial [Deltaproteobacteria bacterium]